MHDAGMRLPPSSQQPAILQFELARRCFLSGDSQGAIGALRAAISIDPLFAEAHKSLATLLTNSGRHEEAWEALEAAVRALPDNADLRVGLARAQANGGDAGAALGSLADAIAAEPSSAVTWAGIGGLFAEFGRWTDARHALEEAAKRDPNSPAIQTVLAHARHETGANAEALEGLAQVAKLHPENLNVSVDSSLMLPLIYESSDDLLSWRARYMSGLDLLANERPRWLANARQVLELNHHNFLLAYQGHDDCEAQRRYSSFLSELVHAAAPEWQTPRPITFDGGRRLRIGFASGIFHDCTAGRYFERWVTALDARSFERFVYHSAPLTDELTLRIRATADHFTTIRAGAADAAKVIARDNLDLLVYPEVGMTPLSYLLATMRLAPVQCAAWGHPVTTGSDKIDFYLTCAAMEPPGSSAHYIERLIGLPGIGVDYAMPASRVEPAIGRAALGLSDNAHVYVCPQSLFKIHPDMDAIFAQLLERDPHGVLLFFQAPSREVTLQFSARLQRALHMSRVPARSQVKFVPRLDAYGFRSVVGLADVVLDTVHWSGGNTSLDAIAAGTPIVTWPGRFMRGRQSAAMLGMMGMSALVASSAGTLLQIAVDVATDHHRNAWLREQVVAHRGILFERKETITMLEQVLLQMAAGRSSVDREITANTR